MFFKERAAASEKILKVMKRADSCAHRQAVKNIRCEKKLFKSHVHSSKFGKRVEKHTTSTNQK